jgi:hypothetical protein
MPRYLCRACNRRVPEPRLRQISITTLVTLHPIQMVRLGPGSSLQLEALDVLIKLSAVHAPHSTAPELDRRELPDRTRA